MSRVERRSISLAAETGSLSGRINKGSSLPRCIPPQLCHLVKTAPSGPQWLHKIKLDGYRMAARIDDGHAQLLTRTGLDRSDEYPSAVEGLSPSGG